MKFKVITIIVFVVMSFVACQKPAKDSATGHDSSSFYYDDTLTVLQENPKIIEFKSFVNELDSSDAASSLLAYEKFKVLFANQQVGLCDSAFLVFQNLMDTIELKLNDKLQDDTTDFSSLYMNETLSKKVKAFQLSLQKNGFKLSSAEGMAYIEQDRTFPIKMLSSMLSEPMKLYMAEIELENREGFAQDAAIVISYKQHVDRIMWYENFIKNNQQFVMIENCKNYRKAYLTYLLTGFDNTPLYENKENFVLSTYYSNAYKYLLKNYNDSETASLILPYSDAIKNKQPNVINDLIKKYHIKGLIYNFEN